MEHIFQEAKTIQKYVKFVFFMLNLYFLITVTAAKPKVIKVYNKKRVNKIISLKSGLQWLIKIINSQNHMN